MLFRCGRGGWNIVWLVQNCTDFRELAGVVDRPFDRVNDWITDLSLSVPLPILVFVLGFVCLSVCLSPHACACVWICLSVCLSVSLSFFDTSVVNPLLFLCDDHFILLCFTDGNRLSLYSTSAHRRCRNQVQREHKMIRVYA